MLKLTIQNAEEGKRCSPGPLPSAVPCASVTQRVSLGKQIASKPASGPSNWFGYPAAASRQCHTRSRLDQTAKGKTAVMRHSLQLSEALLGTPGHHSQLSRHQLLFAQYTQLGVVCDTAYQ